jgi:hypothetical protein
MRFTILLVSAVLVVGLASAPNASLSASSPRASSRVGVCYRLGASCHHDVVLVEPSGDDALDETALYISAKVARPSDASLRAMIITGWGSFYISPAPYRPTIGGHLAKLYLTGRAAT